MPLMEGVPLGGYRVIMERLTWLLLVSLQCHLLLIKSSSNHADDSQACAM